MPSSTEKIVFGPFCLDLRADLLTRDGIPVDLRPRTFAVLKCLALRPGTVLERSRILDEVWGDREVYESALTLCVNELRKALQDRRPEGRIIETVHGRGYRFAVPAAAQPAAPVCRLVGREAEMAALAAAWERSGAGGTTAFSISGEPGIGKTALAREFLRRCAAAGAATAVGQCVEHRGPAEPLLPLLEAISGLARHHEDLAATLRRSYPAWLHGLLGIPVNGAPESPSSQTEVVEAVAGCLRGLARSRPILLLVEDAHWIDPSSVETLRCLVREARGEPLMVLVTTRPLAAIAADHPLARFAELATGCSLDLQPLSAESIGTLIDARFPSNRFPAGLSALLASRSEGNPLFLEALLDHMVARGLVRTDGADWQLAVAPGEVARAVPEALHALVRAQIEQMSAEDRELIECASVCGLQSNTLALAAMLEASDALGVEARVASLTARQAMLRQAGVQRWPDGGAGTRVELAHGIYQSVIYDMVPLGLRRRWHRAFAARIEAAYGTNCCEVAACLADHYARAGEGDLAFRYHRIAGEAAERNFAFEEAASHYEAALAAISRGGEPAHRAAMLCALGSAYIAARGYTGPAMDAFQAAVGLASGLGETPLLVRARLGLAACLLNRAEIRRVRALAGETRDLARRLVLPGPVVAFTEIHCLQAALYAGDAADAAGGVEELIARVDAGMRSFAEYVRESVRWRDPAVALRCAAAAVKSFCGDFERGRALREEAVARARALGQPFTLAYALAYGCFAYDVVVRDWPGIAERAREALEIARRYGFPSFTAPGQLLLGRALVGLSRRGEGLTHMREAIALYDAQGVRLPGGLIRALYAEACLDSGEVEEAAAAVERGLRHVEETGERMAEAELLRLRALALDASGRRAEACRSLEAALALARKQRVPEWIARVKDSMARMGASETAAVERP